ncbi:MAG TPA: transglutaminase family protein [Candidatus Saccharimonadales bacterium]|nr:transglutaminase family protein [Candidatus Saccharimonadales bacterium]
MKKVLPILFFLISLFTVTPQQSFAQTTTETAYNVTYSVNQTGMTHANFAVSLKNTTSDFYVSSYSLQVGFSAIESVQASDGKGINPIIKKNKDGYLISLHFNKQVVGVGRLLQFTLSFDTPDVAQRTGQIWEINIPGIGKQANFSDFSVHVNVPPSFGKARFIKPEQVGNELDFTKDQLGNSGISITFGQQQVYSFDLTYNLGNKNLFPLQTEIALPPTTNYQNVAIENINPAPSNVTRDKDGNWLAQYTLLPSKKIKVRVKGRVFVADTPTQEVVPQDALAQYTQAQPYWQTRDTTIKQLADQLKTPEKIYDYVRTHLTYDFSRVTVDQKRLGGAYVAQHPQSAVCLEFTDLFVAIARAAGIPARSIDGFAYTQNTKERPTSLLVNDILHAWPEYYDQNSQTWNMVDPTWGNTTGGVDYFHVLDFDHVAFSIRGMNSSYPVPAGGYKLEGQENEKDVQVTFATDTKLPDPKISIVENLPKETIAGLPIQSDVTIANVGETAVSQQQITVTTEGISPKEQQVIIQAIPPYGHISVPLHFSASSFLTNTQSVVTIQVGSTTLSKTIKVVPFYLKRDIILGGGIIVISCIILCIIAAGARRLSISRK